MSSGRYDVVIVGSGPVGSAVARTIADEAPGLRVLLVEAGPIVTRPPGRHVKTLPAQSETERAQELSQAGRPLGAMPAPGEVAARPGTYLVGPTAAGMPAAAMSTNVGGMGAHWTCACPEPGEGERIPWIPRPEFDALFAEAGRLLQVSTDAFDSAPLGAEIRSILGDLLDGPRAPERRVQRMPLAVSRRDDGLLYWTGTDVILGDVLERGVELRPETLVTRIDLDDGRVRGVVLRDATGEEEYVGAQVVLVAADSLRTPRLLYVSGVRPPALGRYLNDHLQVMALARLADRFVPDSARVPTRPEPTGTVDPLAGVSWVPYDRESFPYHGQIMQLSASPVPLDPGDEAWPGSVVGLGFFGCKEVRAEDRVTFDEDAPDETGLPGIRIEYGLTEADEATLDGMVAAAARLSAALGDTVGSAPIVMPLGSSLHYMGTVRMGPADDGTSVCDDRGRVWGTTGLYVAGNGVIPTPTACNPTATSIALAIRSARAIVEDAFRFTGT